MTVVWWDIEQGKLGNSGASLGEAVRTFADITVLLPTLGPGDKIFIVPRKTPYSGYMNMNRSGSISAQISFECAPYGGNADMPTMTNPVQANSGGNNIMIFDVNASYVSFKRIRFMDSWYAAIIQYQAKTGLLIEDCEFTRLGMGVRLKSGGFTIRRCKFYDIDRMVQDQNLATDYGGVGISFEALAGDPLLGGLVEDCDFDRCMADSKKFGKDGGAWEVFRGLLNIIIRNCRVRRCKGVIELGGSGLSDSISGLKLINVIAEDNYGLAWFFNDPAGDFAVSIAVGGIEVQNCVFDGRDRDLSLWFMDGLWGNLSTKIKIRNSIFVGSTSKVFKMDDSDSADINTIDHQYNDIYRIDGLTGSANLGFTLHATEISADPMFVDREGGNYRLAEGSPCIGIGQVIAGYTADFTGRAINTPPDIGAFQFVEPIEPAGTILKASPQSRMTDRSPYPTDYSNNVAGGVHHFDTEAERNDMVQELKKPGMWGMVKDVPNILSRDLKTWWNPFAPKPEYEPAVCEIAYVVTSGTPGGNAVSADVWATRPLNTIERNFSDSRPANPNYADVTLNTTTSRFTLTAGIYYVEARAVANKTNAARLKLWDVSTASTAFVKLSFPGWAPTANDGNSVFMIPKFYLSLKKSTTFELQQISDNLDGTTPQYQFGRPVGAVTGGDGNVETYARIQIERIR